jgi:CBS domain-containing protein
MPDTVRTIMAPDPVCLSAQTTIRSAAEAMRDNDIGDVLVVGDGEHVAGIATDRDIVVRAVAEGLDPSRATLGEVCSRDVLAVGPDDPIGDVIELMRAHAVRRVPVLEGERPVGIVSLGDLAIERDRGSALADISDAPPSA